ncbi:hypothetical protein MASR1M29_01970 [Cloacibacterium normanense]
MQSTAYPLFAVNPQKFLENPYKAEKSDYTKAFQKIFNNSVIEIGDFEIKHVELAEEIFCRIYFQSKNNS